MATVSAERRRPSASKIPNTPFFPWIRCQGCCGWAGMRWRARAVSAERRRLSASWILNTPFFPWNCGAGDQRRSGWAKCGGRGRRVEDLRKRRRIHGFAQGGGHKIQERVREGRKEGGLAAGRGGVGGREIHRTSLLEACINETQHLSVCMENVNVCPGASCQADRGLSIVNLCYILIACPLDKVLALRLCHPMQSSLFRISSRPPPPSLGRCSVTPPLRSVAYFHNCTKRV